MEINNVPVRLTADPDEVATTKNGKRVVTFNVAYNWRTRTQDGFTDVATTFFRCTLWEEDGADELAGLNLRKGALVRVSGRWSKSRWTDRDGKARIGDNLTVTAVSVSQSTEITRRETDEPEPDVEPQPARRSRRAA
jgi:single stranded DNA-binding protein